MISRSLFNSYPLQAKSPAPPTAAAPAIAVPNAPSATNGAERPVTNDGKEIEAIKADSPPAATGPAAPTPFVAAANPLICVVRAAICEVICAFLRNPKMAGTADAAVFIAPPQKSAPNNLSFICLKSSDSRNVKNCFFT